MVKVQSATALSSLWPAWRPLGNFPPWFRSEAISWSGWACPRRTCCQSSGRRSCSWCRPSAPPWSCSCGASGSPWCPSDAPAPSSRSEHQLCVDRVGLENRITRGCAGVWRPPEVCSTCMVYSGFFEGGWVAYKFMHSQNILSGQ